MQAGPTRASPEAAGDSPGWLIDWIDEPDSWLPVPRGMNDAAIGEWGRQVLASLESGWGDAWDDEFSYPLALMLDGIARTRDLDHGPMYLCWPLPFPVCMTITLNVMDSADAPDWGALGYEMVHYEASGLGPGIHCVLEQLGEVAGRPTGMVSAAFVFDDGVFSVVVATDTVPPRVAALVNPDLQQFIQSLVLTRPDRSSFHGVASRRLLPSDEDVWEFEDGN